MNTLPSALRALREKASLSPADLARKMDVSRNSVHYWEKEEGGKIPSASTFQRLLDLYRPTKKDRAALDALYLSALRGEARPSAGAA